MTTTARILAAAVAVLALTLSVGAGAVMAADPSPTVGGRLAAVNDTISVTAQGSLPVHVALTADVVQISDASFDLVPGETHNVTFTGEAVGRVYATFSARQTTTNADSNSLTLSVGLKPYVAPMDWTPLGIGGGIALVLLALSILPARWVRRHVRIVRA